MIRRPPRSTQSRSSAASDVYKRQVQHARGGDVRRDVAGAPGEAVVDEGVAQRAQVDEVRALRYRARRAEGHRVLERVAASAVDLLSLIHISEPTRLGMT